MWGRVARLSGSRVTLERGEELEIATLSEVLREGDWIAVDAQGAVTLLAPSLAPGKSLIAQEDLLARWSSFLARRMAPAMRTCAAMEDRQSNLSIKLARAADLLRTRVDVELEEQNRDLLRSMNERTKLQLRLQSTVEGLSVAAIGYYVVSLFGYLAKGAHDGGLPVEPSLATALFVPVAVGVIWIIIHNIRKRHLKHDSGMPVGHD